MSNKVFIIAATTIVIIASGIFILARSGSKQDPLVSVSSQMATSSNSKSVLVSSSQLAAISSQSESVKVVEVPSASKAVEVRSQVAQAPVCNLPESENLVKTEDGCFELFYSYFDSEVFKDPLIPPDSNYNENKLFNTKYNQNLIKKIALDFYSQNKTKSKQSNLYLRSGINSKKTNDTFTISMYLFENSDSSQTNYLANQNYKIFQTNNKDWSYQVIKQ